ncbi:hypothetical protein CN692_09225 [Bacillus sp. AFS002410]|uniref:hypothetical protein n=1 Tax=Bacillus sp. AFS002410 TaxID=2033481 RepID=UPI000BEFB915|nr:hypothetical protein [Bacillus sp. AFS002410]PEJ58443.1 hypothetical protein CN692_09225 [Bacillus sp. AFS002410]
MDKIHALIGEHLIQITSNNIDFATSIFNENKFLIPRHEHQLPLLRIHIEKGYGVPFVDYQVKVTKEKGKIYFQRADYLIETDEEYTVSTVFAHNQLALKHALTNLYSSYIVYHNWGLLIHSSCVIEEERAHIFAGQSGAGKSTAAKLSHPRLLLSDEATLIKITPNEITVFDSPFRSEIKSTGLIKSSSLASVQLLHQSLENNRAQMSKSDGFLHLMDKIFYWAHDPSETKKIVGLLEILINEVPIYNLYFQKNNIFWELIS